MLCMFIVVAMTSCSPVRNVPMVKDVGLDPFGSVIRVYGYPKGSMWIQGELISVDFFGIYLLEQTSVKAIRIERSLIKNYELFPTKARSYAGFIPLTMGLSISQGVLGFFTLPVNLITTISLAAAGAEAFNYDEKEIGYDRLSMFARFPQGLPKEVDLTKLKGRD